ncbi:MAG TPA: nuclear transport factor 2 family protein [Acidimicrobiales bacterium]|nr:nuclear transport factor 2 family protein [Acidimicrobiales bacterium]
MHRATDEAFNAADLDGLVALYESDACMVRVDGSVAEGSEAIRAEWAGLMAVGGRLASTTRYVIGSGDLALLRGDFTFTSGDVAFGSTTAEVVRRQPDGTWLYVIDHPSGSAE